MSESEKAVGRKVGLRSALKALFRWHEPGTPREDKWLIFKLDLFILLYSCLYLDQQNGAYFFPGIANIAVNNAWVSGMQEDLHLAADVLNSMTTYFNIGVIVGAPLFTFGLTFIRPSILLPACTAIWSVFVLGHYKCQTASALYAMRFFTGFFESGLLPGCYYVIGSWYRRSEIIRRAQFFFASSYIGTMFSGYIQSGLLHSMQGRGGLRAWQWLFIFDCIIGVPIIIFGVCCYPDEPKTTRAWWLSPRERLRAVERMAEEGRDADVRHLSWDVLRRAVKSWAFWVFPLSRGLSQVDCSTLMNRWFTLYLNLQRDAHGHRVYSIYEVNNLPTILSAVTIVAMVIASILADAYNARPAILFFAGSVISFSFIILAIWPTSHGLKLAAYFLGGFQGVIDPMISAWLSVSCGGDDQVRALATGFMIALGYAVETPAQQYLYPTADAPEYKPTHGYIYGAVFAVLTTLWCSIGLPAFIKWKCRERRGDNCGNVCAAAPSHLSEEGCCASRLATPEEGTVMTELDESKDGIANI